MGEMNGYKTLDVVMAELGIGETKVRQAIIALGITPTTFNIDKRTKYYSPEDIQKIKDWLQAH